MSTTLNEATRVALIHAALAMREQADMIVALLADAEEARPPEPNEEFMVFGSTSRKEGDDGETGVE